MPTDLSKFAILVGQVALLVLEELNSTSNRLKSSQIKEQLLERRQNDELSFENENYAFELNKSTGKEQWYYVIGLAVSTLKFKNYKSGPHGIWEITDFGKEFLEKSDERENKEKALSQYFRDFHKASYSRIPSTSHSDDILTTKTDTSTQIEEDEEIEESPFNEDDMRSSFFEHLEKLDPYDFQQLVGFLFEGMGYTVSYVSKPGPDGGVDIIAHKDPIGVDCKIVKVQVKHSESVDTKGIGMNEVRQIRALCGDDSVPVFVSLKGFTAEAERRARTEPGSFIPLIDNVRFVDLWIEHIDNIPYQGKKMFPLKKVYVIDSE